MSKPSSLVERLIRTTKEARFANNPREVENWIISKCKEAASNCKDEFELLFDELAVQGVKLEGAKIQTREWLERIGFEVKYKQKGDVGWPTDCRYILSWKHSSVYPSIVLLQRLTKEAKIAKDPTMMESWVESKCTEKAKKGESSQFLSFEDLREEGMQLEFLKSDKAISWLEKLGFKSVEFSYKTTKPSSTPGGPPVKEEENGFILRW